MSKHFYAARAHDCSASYPAKQNIEENERLRAKLAAARAALREIAELASVQSSSFGRVVKQMADKTLEASE